MSRERLREVTNLSGKDLVLLALEEASKPLTTKQAFIHPLVNSHLKYSSVKIYLRQLLLEGKVSQVFPRGPYEVIKSTHGVLGGLKLHDVQLQVSGQVRESRVFDRWFGDVHVYMTFGLTRGLVTCSIGKGRPPRGGRGLEWSEWVFAKSLFIEKASEAVGRAVSEPEVQVLNSEVGNDLLGRRIEGLAKCVTLTSFNGVLERIYQKDEETVRREVKVENTTIEQIEALWRGGVTPYNLIQSTQNLVNRLDAQERRLNQLTTAIMRLVRLEEARFKRDDARS